MNKKTLTIKQRNISMQLKLLKNRAYGKIGTKMATEFFIRKAYHGEWAVEVLTAPWHEVIAWCKETLGECGNDRKYRWRQNYRPEVFRIFLRNESDVTLFRLRWL